MKKLCTAALICISTLFVQAQTNILPYNSVWKYLDNGSNQGTAWRATAFNDASWLSGAAELGYGDGDEATTVNFGNNPKKKFITTYFRKAITIADASLYSSYTLNIKRDDGVVVYVNGTEVYRNNMPTGTISYTTKASSEIADDGNTIQTVTLPAGSLVTGNNVVAVEIHINNGNGNDISFRMELIANSGFPTATLTRGPYLQMINQSEASLRWRTNIASDSKISVGTIHGSYTLSATNSLSATEHEIRITGLDADTKYFYQFGSSSQVLQAGTDNYFITAPPSTTTRKIRIASFGDCGRNDNGFQTGSLNSYRTYTGNNPAELLLLVGDNAYNSGTDNEYQSNFFNAYSSTILKNHALFPSPGNHDYANDANRQNDHNVPYYQIFNLPSNAQCGGLASGTEAYYSYDWGNIHFLSLDSYGEENGGTTRLYDTLGAQVTWIKADLAANNKKWTIAYWHHPPFTMGSHNSDTEGELINIRNNFIRILERFGVDMIICGHSHDYERSYLLRNYFGNEASFTPSIHTASTSSAKYDNSANSCPYATESGPVNHGTVYVVAGSSGADGGIQTGYPHNALPFSVDNGGMLYFEIENNRLDAKFIRRDGVIADQFSIVKDVNNNTAHFVNAGSSIDLTASWIGNYSWSTGETTRTITVAPSQTTSYIVGDGVSCLSDTFNVNVINTLTKNTAGNPSVTIEPNLVKKGQMLKIKTKTEKKIKFIISDINGRVVKQFITTGDMQINTTDLHPGIFFIKWQEGKKMQTRKFVLAE